MVCGGLGWFAVFRRCGNFGALRISYRYEACNGVIKLAINKIWKINQPSFFPVLLLAKEFNFIVFMHSCNNAEIFLGKHEFVSLSNKQLEINFTLMQSRTTFYANVYIV